MCPEQGLWNSPGTWTSGCPSIQALAKISLPLPTQPSTLCPEQGLWNSPGTWTSGCPSSQLEGCCSPIVCYSLSCIYNVWMMLILVTINERTNEHCLPTHTSGSHTFLGSVFMLYIYTVVQSLYTRTDSEQWEYHKYNQTDPHRPITALIFKCLPSFHFPP